LADAVNANESATTPPALGVIGEARVKLTPEGAVPTHEADNVTGELNPFNENTLTVALPLPPGMIVTEGLDVIEKSAPPLVVLVVLFSVVVNGAVTVKLADAESPLGLLLAVTV